MPWSVVFRLRHALLGVVALVVGDSLLPSSALGCGPAEVTFASVVLDADGDEQCTLPPTYWMPARITGTCGRAPVFRVPRQGVDAYRSGHRMAYRYQGESGWHFFAPGRVEGEHYCFGKASAFTGDTVYIAYWVPWSYGEMSAYLADLEGRRFVRNLGSRGRSAMGREIWGVEVTDPSVSDALKRRVVVIARQHYNEPPSSFVIRGMMDYLIHSHDAMADRVRKLAVFHFYPMCDPDSVALGHDRDLASNPNREWWPGAPPSGKSSAVEAINVLRRAIIEDTGGQADVALDLHAHPGHSGPYYWWGIKSGAAVENAAAVGFVARVERYDAAGHGGQSIIAGEVASDVLGWPWGPPADLWFYDTLGALAFTLEAGSAPAHGTDRISDIGVALCQALCDTFEAPAVFDPPPVVTGR